MKNYVIILIIMLLWSCKSESEHVASKQMNTEFSVCTTGVDSVREFPADFNIKQWGLCGDTLYVLSKERKNFLKLITLEDMSLLDSFGNIGTGPGEFISPRLISSDNGGMFLGDGMLGMLQSIKNGKPGNTIDCSEQPIPLNDAYILRDSLLAYVFYSPLSNQLLVQDFSTKAVCDSLQLPLLPFPNEEMSTESFQVGSNDRYFVVAYQGIERFDIIMQSGGSIFGEATVFQGNSSLGPKNFFFIDIACGDSYFALLSMAGKDVENEESYPDIEIYDYQGNPLAKITIDFMAYKLLIDERNNSLLLLSSSDENLHVITMPKFSL